MDIVKEEFLKEKLEEIETLLQEEELQEIAGLLYEIKSVVKDKKYNNIIKSILPIEEINNKVVEVAKGYDWKELARMFFKMEYNEGDDYDFLLFERNVIKAIDKKYINKVVTTIKKKYEIE